MKKFFKKLAVKISDFWNWLPEAIKIPIYVNGATAIITLLSYLAQDIQELGIENRYIIVLLGFVVSVVNVIIFYIKEKIGSKTDVEAYRRDLKKK